MWRASWRRAGRMRRPSRKAVQCTEWSRGDTGRPVMVVNTNPQSRHTAATLLLVQGVDQRVVMSMFGWTSPSMTTRYQHVAPELVEEANRRMSELLWGARAVTPQSSLGDA